MKNIIITIGEILLGVIVFMLIFGTGGSLREQISTSFTDLFVRTSLIHN